ncbi:CHAD domain-containing protein [Pseudomonas sp.]|uniref:CHAD domain-containing protein n=1 Tax=Pseudomonas sp. TaxID=306 RepID=UPI003D115094
MTRMVDELLEQVVRLQVSLLACRERMRAGTDDEALHDLRIAIRRLRSLLRPMRGVPACEALENSAAEVGRLSSPLRDQEVLLAYLRKQGVTTGLAERQQRVQTGYERLLASSSLRALFVALDDWPARWFRADAEGELKKLRSRVRRRLRKQQRRLLEALDDPAHDRHRLRLLIKRVRYGADAYSAESTLSKPARTALKKAQSALGEWHDTIQWLGRAEVEADLAPCVDTWRAASLRAQARADEVLQTLRGHLQD